MSHTIILQTGVGGQAPTAGVFSQCSTEICLHIAAFRRQEQLLCKDIFFFFFVFGSNIMESVYQIHSCAEAADSWRSLSTLSMFMFFYFKIRNPNVHSSTNKIVLFHCGKGTKTAFWPAYNTFHRKTTASHVGVRQQQQKDTSVRAHVLCGQLRMHDSGYIRLHQAMTQYLLEG